MSFAAVAVAGIGAGATIYMGAKQKRDAKRVRDNAVNPGVQPNFALDRATQTLFQNYSNWNLPGYSKYIDQLGSNQATSNAAVLAGATSSADILNAVTNNQIGANQSAIDVAIAQASGKEKALMQYLQSSQQQGQDQVRMNQEQQQQYQGQLREAAALEGAGMQNMNNGFQDLLTASSAIVGNFMPRQTVSSTTGEIIKLPSVWEQLYGKKKSV